VERSLPFISDGLHAGLRCLVICILILASPAYFCASAENTTPTEEDLYQQCRELFSKGSFTETDGCIAKFRSTYPESKHDGEMLFMQAFLQPAIDTSIEMYQALIGKYSSSEWAARSHFQIGQCYYLQGEYDKALDHYGKIIVSYPEHEVYWPARYWKCRSLIAKGDYEEAMKALRSLDESAAERIGRDIILMAVGNCYLGMKDYERAEATYRSLIESIPDSQRIPSAHLLLAKSLQNQGELEEAKEIYQKVIKGYRQSIEAQQAQRYLDALSPTQPEATKAKPTVPRTTTETQKPAAKPASYFTIQIGAFSIKRNADNLANRLTRKGYSVSVIPPVSGKSRLYKVVIGKYKTKNGALKAAQRIGRNEKLDTAVIHQ
jgi:TolA-binding protein